VNLEPASREYRVPVKRRKWNEEDCSTDIAECRLGDVGGL
jgi:hypothetical protein